MPSVPESQPCRSEAIACLACVWGQKFHLLWDFLDDHSSCLSREPVTGISKDSSAAGHYPDSFPISPCSTSMNAAYRARKNNGTECSSASWSMLFIACVVSQKAPRPLGALWYSCFLERESTMGSLGLLRPSPEGTRLQEDLDCKWPWGFLFLLVSFCLLT